MDARHFWLEISNVILIINEAKNENKVCDISIFPSSWQTSTWKSAKKLKRRLRFITAEEETDKIEMFPTCVTQKNETFRAVEIAERRFGTKNNSRLEVGASRRRLATLHQGLPDYDDAGRRDVSWTKDSLPSSVERDDPNDGVTALRSSARVLIAKSPS